MIRLASNDKFLLMKCPSGHGGFEYYYFLPDLSYGCLNSQGPDYNAKNALEYCERQYGKATYTRPTIGAC